MTDLYQHFMNEALSIPDPYPETPKRSVNHSSAPEAQAPQPVAGLSDNELRPSSFADVIGQQRTKALLQRIVRSTKARGEPLDHMLMVGPSGMGKTTLAVVMANEIGAAVYQVQAPISHDTLLALRTVMKDGDVLFIDEIHLQAVQERRGKSSATQPEVMFGVMEDRVIATESGNMPFPKITLIGATTDEGMLPDAFINRFPLRPVLEPYAPAELAVIVRRNAETLGLTITEEARLIFANASRGVPRQINNYVKNARSISMASRVGRAEALEVVQDMNRTELDGLNLDMVNLLTFLYEKCGRTTPTGERVYMAGVGTLATALGKSRDQKAVALRVEPFLIGRGFLQVGHGGRRLTELGIARAQELLNDRREA